MKKLLFAMAVCCAVMVQAAAYSYLVFTNTGGTTTGFNVSNLTLTVNGSNLQVTNDEGTVNLVLTDLASMQFSNDGSLEGIGNILEADKPIDIYTPLGAKMGHFNNLMEAVGSLNKGLYVISNGSVTQKIVIQ